MLKYIFPNVFVFVISVKGVIGNYGVQSETDEPANRKLRGANQQLRGGPQSVQSATQQPRCNQQLLRWTGTGRQAKAQGQAQVQPHGQAQGQAQGHKGHTVGVETEMVGSSDPSIAGLCRGLV